MDNQHDYLTTAQQYRPALYRLAGRILGNIHDDDTIEYIVSGVIQHIWQRMYCAGVEVKNLHGLLRKAVSRRCLDHLRDRPPEVSLDALAEDDSSEGWIQLCGVTDPPDMDMIRDVHTALECLEPLDQSIAWGTLVEGVSNATLAQELGISRGKVWHRLQVILPVLREKLRAYDGCRYPRPDA